MSILNGPRINFWGGIEVDVSTVNNAGKYPIDKNGNLTTGTTKNPVFDVKNATMNEFVIKNGITDEQIMDILRSPADIDRKEGFTNGGWNIYGQHSVVTNNVVVSSAGEPGAVSTETPLADLPITLLGSVNPATGQREGSPVMVDLNPLGSVYSQIVLGGVLIGDIDKPLLHLQGDKIASNIGLDHKVLNGGSFVVYSGTFQVTFDKSEILASGQTKDKDQNKAIQTFLATEGMEGIVINFSFFEGIPRSDTPALLKSYVLNENERNPVEGRVVGTVGIAFAGETAQNPDGRLLKNGAGNATAYACSTSSSDGTDLLAVNLSIALTQEKAREDRTGYATTPIDPAIDAGPLSLFAGTQELRQFSPDYTNYYLYGGISDVVLNKAQMTSAKYNQLSIFSSLSTDSFVGDLVESSYRLYSDAINVYMGEKAGYKQDIELQLRYLGQAVTAETTIVVGRVDLDGFNKEQYLDTSVQQVTFPAGQASTTYTLTNAATSNGIGGFEQMGFFYPDQKNPETMHTVNTRKYMYTDFGIAKGATVTWDQAYNNALRYHYLNFLGMSNVFPLNDANTIKNNAAGIRTRTSSEYMGTSLYMPIVRSMSPSQIRLINAYTSGEGWDPDVEI